MSNEKDWTFEEARLILVAEMLERAWKESNPEEWIPYYSDRGKFNGTFVLYKGKTAIQITTGLGGCKVVHVLHEEYFFDNRFEAASIVNEIYNSILSSKRHEIMQTEKKAVDNLRKTLDDALFPS